MSVKVGELYGTLGLDKKPFDKALDDTESKGKGWASRIAGVLGGAATALVKWGAVGATVAAGGAFALGNMASDLNETISKSEVVFGRNAQMIQAWADDAALNMGLSKNAALGAASTFGNLFVSMGIGERATNTMSTGIVELAGDLASFNNMDPTEVLEKLRAGLVGEAEPLRQLGVNITAAATEAKAMELGLGGVGRELTAAEKAQANYAIIMEQTTTAQGDFARTSEGMANQQRITAATFQDTMAAIGQAFIPIIEAILPQITAALGQFQAWVITNMPTIQAVAETVFSAIGAAITFLFTDVLPMLVDAISWLSTNVLPTLVDAFNTFTNDVLPALIDVVEDVAKVVLPAVGAAFDVLTNTIIPAIIGAIDFLRDNWEHFGPIFKGVAIAIAGVLAGVLTVAFVSWATAAGAAAVATIAALAPVLVPIAAIGLAIGALVWVWEHFGDDIKRIIGSVARKIEEVFGSISDFMGDVWDNISGAFKSGVNFVIGLVNRLIGFLNGISIPIPRISIPGTDIGIGGGRFDPFNIGRLPYLAEGVRGFGGGWAVVGEAGPELVNLPRGSDVFSAQESVSMLNGDLTVTIRDGDGALARGGYSQDGVERAVVAALGRFADGMAHRSIRAGGEL